MNQKEFDAVVTSTIESIRKLLTVKGGEYAGSDDRLANFKRGASATGVNPLTVLHVYMNKHYDSFTTYVRDQQTGKSRELSEPMEGRLDDIINYCILAKAILAEAKFDPRNPPLKYYWRGREVSEDAYHELKQLEEKGWADKADVVGRNSKLNADRVIRGAGESASDIPALQPERYPFG